MASFSERMIGAAMLDPRIYEEVEADPSAMGQAMAVVAISSVAAGIGTVRAGGIVGVVVAVIVAFIGWFIWAGLTFVIGTKMLPEPQTRSDIGELLRTIGFSASPGVLRVLGFIPILGPLISLAAGFWMLAAMVVAVRQALDYKSTGRAIGVCVIGFVVYIAIGVMIGIAFATAGALGRALS
jgi:hypothetical protein